VKLVLSIDGGGIRGILPATLLDVLQRSAHWPKFDMIAGTSTGGILACGLCSGVPAKQMLELYTTHGGEVFDRKLASGFVDPKYDSANLERLLKAVLGSRKLSQASPELLVPSYCVQYPSPVAVDGVPSGAGSWFFKSWDARGEAHSDFALWQVARATSAAPTYFPTASVAGYWFVDGGVFANNPALCALVDAMKLWPDDEIKLLSLGTGAKVTAIDGLDSQGWGIAQWATEITTLFMDGAADATSYHLNTLLGPRFLRCEIPLVGVADAFDDASALNITNLQALGVKFTSLNLARVVQFLS
jgi:hypothetical protein